MVEAGSRFYRVPLDYKSTPLTVNAAWRSTRPRFTTAGRRSRTRSGLSAGVIKPRKSEKVTLAPADQVIVLAEG